MVLGVCRRILGNAADAEDAFQATFLVLVRKAASLTTRSVLGDWLHGVARRTALNARRIAARGRAKEKAMARPEAKSDALRDEGLSLLDEELSRLPEKYRLVIVLCDLEGKTRREAAESLGWPEGTVAGRLARGRALLAKQLTRKGLSLSAGALMILLSQQATAGPVSTSLVVSTVKVATLFASSPGAVTGAISTKVAGLAEAVVKSLFLSKLKSTLTAMLAGLVLLALVSGAMALGLSRAQKEDPNSADLQAPPQHENPDEQKQPDAPKGTNATADPAPQAGSTPSDSPVILPSSTTTRKTVVQLPATIEHLAVGAGGRFLILHLKSLNKLAVFDAAEGKIVEYLPAPEEEFLFQAGEEKLVMIVPKKRLIELWSLQTFQKERSAALPVDFDPARAALGSSSFGPLLLWGPLYDSALIDLDSLKKIEVKGLKIEGNTTRNGLEIEAAADGTAFTTWNRLLPGEHPSEFRVFRLRGDTISMSTGLSLESPCHASMNDGPVFTGDGKIYTPEMAHIPARALEGATLIPVGSGYFVAAHWDGTKRKARVAVHFSSDLKEAFTLKEAGELDGIVTGKLASPRFTWEKRIHFVPSANVFLTIPATNDRIVVRRIDVDTALKSSGADYLYVTSVPLRRVRRGATYEYQVQVKAKRDNVEYSLDSGPEGMTISPQGRVSWYVPPDFQESKASVIVSVRVSPRQQIFHSFTINCE
jgi:RNA polymerase sigma factor (sigma-70 family)